MSYPYTFLLCLVVPQFVYAISTSDYNPIPPDVIIQRSAFDYPSNFTEQYLLPNCDTSPLAVDPL